MEILQRITPTNVSNFVGNRVVVSNITKWLQQVKNKEVLPKNILCIMGPDGSGKTILSTLLLKKYDFHVLEIGKDILTNDNIKTLIENFTNNMTIEHCLLKRQKIIFVDDLDILLCVDRMIVSKILTYNKTLKQKHIHVIVTCNSNIDKKLFNDNEAEYFKLSYPSCKDSFSYIMHKLDEACVDYNMEHLLQVVTKHKGNIRESILNLHNSQIDLETKSIERTFKDMNQFEIAKAILGKKNTVQEVDHLVKGDTGNLPYIMYENMPAELEANYKTSNIIDSYLKVNSNFIDAVLFDERAYTNMDWGLLQYSSILRCTGILNEINQHELKAAQKNITYKFSQMRSKCSHKKILGKKVKNVSNVMQTSENSLIVAADTKAREAHRVKDKGSQEMSCLVSTYEKYFV